MPGMPGMPGGPVPPMGGPMPGSMPGQMGGPMAGPMGGVPMGGAPPQAGYPAYGGAFGQPAPAANDPMWGYFTSIAGQVRPVDFSAEPVLVNVPVVLVDQ